MFIWEHFPEERYIYYPRWCCISEQKNTEIVLYVFAQMAKVWDIVYDIDEKDFCLFEKAAVGWKNEGKITAITTTLEVGIVRVSH